METWRSIPGDNIGISDLSADGGVSYTAISEPATWYGMPEENALQNT